jgi:hypothetical protein
MEEQPFSNVQSANDQSLLPTAATRAWFPKGVDCG